jgi:Neuraminidase (sialidase)
VPGVFTPAITLPAANTALLLGLYADGADVHYALISSGNLVYLYSRDEGRTWSGTTTIQTSVDDVPLTAGLAVDKQTVHLVYATSVDATSAPAALWYRRSTDAGLTWSSAVQVDDGTAHGNNRFYRLSLRAKDGYAHLAWVSTSATTFNTDGLYYIRSTDGGATWSATSQPYSATVNSPGRPGMSLDGDVVALTYTDERYGTYGNGSGEVMFARSRDRGVTWETEIRITNTSGLGASSFGCLRPDVYAYEGVVTLMWQNTSDGTDDLYWSYSVDGGVTFSSPAQFTNGAGVEEHVMFSGRGRTVYAFYTDHSDLGSTKGQIYYAISSDGGVTWGTKTRLNPTSIDQTAARTCTSNKFVHVIYGPGTGGQMYQRQNLRDFPG